MIARVQDERRRCQVGVGEADRDRPGIGAERRWRQVGRRHAGRQGAERARAAVGRPAVGDGGARLRLAVTRTRHLELQPGSAVDGAPRGEHRPVGLAERPAAGEAGEHADREGAGPVGGGGDAHAHGGAVGHDAIEGVEHGEPARVVEGGAPRRQPVHDQDELRPGPTGATAIDLRLHAAHEPRLAFPLGRPDHASAVGQRAQRCQAAGAHVDHVQVTPARWFLGGERQPERDERVRDAAAGPADAQEVAVVGRPADGALGLVVGIVGEGHGAGG